MKQFYVYILTNFTNNVFYTGVTNDLVRRVYEHKNKLVYYEIYQDPDNAIKREKSIKNLLRRKKIELINKDNSDFTDLYSTIV